MTTDKALDVYMLPQRALIFEKPNKTKVAYQKINRDVQGDQRGKRYLLKAKLLSHQMKFVYSKSQFPALIGGYGSGKTESLIRRTLYLKFKYKKASVAYYLPTYGLIETIAFPRFTELLTAAGCKFKLNETKKRIVIQGAGTIFFRSMQDPDTIIGYEVGNSLVDEIDTLPIEKATKVFIKILGRNRTPLPDGSHNTVGLGSTPEGYGFCYQKYQKNPKEGYELIKASTYDNPFLSQSYIMSLVEAYPAELIQAYLMGEFVNLNGLTVYSNYNRKTHDTRETVQDGDVLHCGQDFNVSNQATTIGVYRGKVLHIVDEISGALDTPATVEILKTRYPNHKIVIYPDPAGSARHSTGASKTDFTILRAAGFIVDAPPAHPRIKDRVISVQLMFQNAKNERHLLINSDKCPNLVESLECQVYDIAGMPDKKAGFDHLVDSVGYLVHRRHSPNTITLSRISTTFGR